MQIYLCSIPSSAVLHSFIRISSSSPVACSIQPLPPEFLEATPLAASRKAGKTARFWQARFPQYLPCNTLGRWIRSPPNPRGSELADQHSHYRPAPSRAEDRRVSAADF